MTDAFESTTNLRTNVSADYLQVTPLAVSAVGVDEFVLDHLRIQRIGQAIRSESSSGLIFNNYLLGDAPLSVSGGHPMAPARVIAANNTIIYRTAGIASQPRDHLALSCARRSLTTTS